MKLKDKEAWLELYDVAKKIQELEPWKYLWDMDFLVYLSDELQDVFYCSVMGKGGMHKGLAIYRGQQINKLLDMIDNNYPDKIMINYQECLNCNFLSREDTLPENREIIKELGLSFRGTWISFERFEKGYEPSPLNIKQVKDMTMLLGNFYMMLKCIIEQGIKVDFEKGQVLVRHYDKDKKLYLNYPQALFAPDQDYKTLMVSDDYEKAVKQIPQTEMELEYEFLNYLPMKIKANKEKDGRYYLPRVRIMAERKSGFVMMCDLIDKKDYKDEEEYVKESAQVLIDQFYEIGRPKAIYVRDEETKACLENIAEKAQIKLIVRPKFKFIDDFYKGLDRMM